MGNRFQLGNSAIDIAVCQLSFSPDLVERCAIWIVSVEVVETVNDLISLAPEGL